MFIPILAASALAATFAQLGSMAVQISVLTAMLQFVSVTAIALALYVLLLRRKA